MKCKGVLIALVSMSVWHTTVSASSYLTTMLVRRYSTEVCICFGSVGPAEKSCFVSKACWERRIRNVELLGRGMSVVRAAVVKKESHTKPLVQSPHVTGYVLVHKEEKK